jgi:hypothetical protein
MSRMTITQYERFHVVTLLALGVLALLLASCGQLTTPPSAGAKATPNGTATPLPPITADWRPAKFPLGSDLGAEPSVYVVDPSDARVTYACALVQPPGGGDFGAQVWMTQDGGASWSHGVKLPYSGAPLPYGGSPTGCFLAVDAQDPLRVIAWVNPVKLGGNAPPASLADFISQDGGATWRALPKVGPHYIFSLVSHAGVIYAAGGGVDASGGDRQDVWASEDGGVSWRALHANALAPNPVIWLNPQTGEMLGEDNYDLIPSLWRSASGGVSWSRINVPIVADAGAGQTFLVTIMGAGWRICVTASTGPARNSINHIACSADVGVTWTPFPALNPSQYSPKGFTFTAPVGFLAVTADGGLLADYDDISSGVKLEWLAPGASGWALVNSPTNVAVPGVGYVYCSGPAGGAIWAPFSDPTHPFSVAQFP